MDKSNNLKLFLTDLADTIREVRQHSNPINPQNMSDEIRAFKNSVPDKEMSVETATQEQMANLFHLLNGKLHYTYNGVTYGCNLMEVRTGYIKLYEYNSPAHIRLYQDGSYYIRTE